MKSQRPDHTVKRITNTRNVYIGSYIKFDNSIVIACGWDGKFVGRFDGINSYELPSNNYFCEGIGGIYELVLRYFNKEVGG